MTEEKLWMIFKRFDVDNTDFISESNIVDAMKKLGRKISDEEVKEALKDADTQHDQKISF